MTEEEFTRVVRYVERKAGIDLEHKKTLVEGRIGSYVSKADYLSVGDYMNAVEGDYTGREFENLINMLTTNHTYFMREAEHFEFFKKVVLPELMQREMQSRSLYIWCGASSTGEEPYTLAMLIHDFFGFEIKEWDTQILATDISTQVLRTAIKGIYMESQLRQISDRWKHMYFTQIDKDSFQISQTIRQEVLYRCFNLMSPLPFKKPLHVIFLRNVMIYFDKETKQRLLERVVEALAPGGYLFIGTTEAIDRKEIPLDYVRPSVYQKQRQEKEK